MCPCSFVSKEKQRLLVEAAAVKRNLDAQAQSFFGSYSSALDLTHELSNAVSFFQLEEKNVHGGVSGVKGGSQNH